MTGVTRRLDILIAHESVLHADIHRMPGMASYASSGMGIGRLPASQIRVPVIAPACALAPARCVTGNGHRLFGNKSLLGNRLVTL